MKKTKQTLAFEQLEAEMELICQDQLIMYKGGDGSSGGAWEYGMDSSGNLYYRPQGSQDWTAFAALGMGVTGHYSSGYNPSDYPTGFNYNNYYNNVPYNSSGYYYGGGGGGGYPSPPANPANYDQLYVTGGNANMSFLDIAGHLNTSLGLSNTFAQASAVAAKLEIAATFSMTGRVFAVVDIGSNLIEILDTEQSMLQKFEDGGQIGVAVALMFAGGPVTIVAGGIALAAWELWEYTRDH